MRYDRHLHLTVKRSASSAGESLTHRGRDPHLHDLPSKSRAVPVSLRSG